MTTVPARVRDEAIAEAARCYRVQEFRIRSRERIRAVAHARQYAMWLVRQRRANGRAAHSFPSIGAAFGRDQSTARTACVAVEARRFIHSGKITCGPFGSPEGAPFGQDANHRSIAS